MSNSPFSIDQLLSELSQAPLQPLDHNYLFFQQYNQIIGNTKSILDKIKGIVEKRDKLWEDVLQIENRAEREFTDKFRKAQYEKKNRLRKQFSKVNRIFHCDIENCKKSYGSQGSLLQHQKLKHEEIYVQHHKERKKRITIVEQSQQLD